MANCEYAPLVFLRLQYYFYNQSRISLPFQGDKIPFFFDVVLFVIFVPILIKSEVVKVKTSSFLGHKSFAIYLIILLWLFFRKVLYIVTTILYILFHKTNFRKKFFRRCILSGLCKFYISNIRNYLYH